MVQAFRRLSLAFVACATAALFGVYVTRTRVSREDGKPPGAGPLIVVSSMGCCPYVLARNLLVSISDSTFHGGALAELGNIPFPLQDSTYFVVVDGEVYFADRTGRIVKRIGKRGAGPGEYRWVTQVLSTGSEIIMFDGVLGRMTVLEAGTFRVLRTQRLPVADVLQQTGPAQLRQLRVDGIVRG